MVTVCAWCQRYMGSKEPFHNPVVSHGICPTCAQSQSLVEPPVLVVSPARASTIPMLHSLLRGAPDVAIVIDRRCGERRDGNGRGLGNGRKGSPPDATERRRRDRRRETALYLV